MDEVASEFGGLPVLADGARSMVRQAAVLMLRSEQLQAAVIRGDPVNDDQLIRLSSEARRAVDALRSMTSFL
jgi:hypothetical protein